MERGSPHPFLLRPDGKPRASVLLLHGFTGSPWEVRPLGEALAARGFVAMGPRLPGHGVNPEAMFASSAEDWLRASKAAYQQLLEENRPVLVAGLSMGALLGLKVIADEPGAKGLVLLAPIARFRALNARLIRRFSFLPLVDWSGVWLHKESSDIDDPTARSENPVMPKYPLAKLRDLWKVQAWAQASLANIRIPSLVVASRQDHVADWKGAFQLHQGLAQSRWVLLERGYHIVTRDTERAFVNAEVSAFFDRCLSSTTSQGSSYV